MENLKLIETKIEEIRSKIDKEIFKEENERYPDIEKILEKINRLLNYIRNREKWIKAIISVLLFLDERIRIKKSEITDETQKRKLDDIERKIFGMRKGIEREFLYDPDNLIEKLKSDGNKVLILHNSSLAKAINDIAFKLLEKVRLGQRDEIMYLLLRTFKAHDKKLPESLIEALKTKYDDSLFKSFIYVFLAPILGKKQTEGG